MADLRALMRERKATSKLIDHPFAKYSNSGQLSCSLCGLPVKNEVLWPAHLTSKVHRQNVRQQQLEAAHAAEATSSAVVGSKRAADGSLADNEQNDTTDQQGGRAKRVRFEDENEENVESPQVDEDPDDQTTVPSTSFLPPGFFDNPSTSTTNGNASTGQENEAITADDNQDDEMAEFEAFLAQPEPEASTSTSSTAGPSVFSAQATISAEENLFKTGDEEDEQADGDQGGEDDYFENDDGPSEETEEERLQREEREELMERIETEEREQREADERVEALKKRLLTVRAKKGGSAVDKSSEETKTPVTQPETARERRRRRLGKQ